jgi:uncharacterized OB-fold protein
MALHPQPVPTPETQVFWDAAAEGEFLLRWCSSCGRTHWYPRAVCPHCSADATIWRKASGRGIIYSFSIMRRAPVPYAIAYVTLEEGPTMMTNIVDCGFDAIHIGQQVGVTFQIADGDGALRLPFFRPLINQ